MTVKSGAGLAKRGSKTVNTYQLEVAGLTRIPHTVIAETPGQAKYQCFRYFTNELSYVLDFKEFLQSLEYCRKVGGFSPRDLFGDREQFDRMKEMRGIEFAHMGMRVEVCGQMGTIVGANDMNLNVVYDGWYHADNCHPWYRVKYFDKKGNIVAEYGE